MQTKKEWIKSVIHNQPSDRIPAGFWFHYLQGADQNLGTEKPELLEISYAGHAKYRDEINPDFVKAMTDGLFFRPASTYPEVTCVEDLYKIEPLPEDHYYVSACVAQAKKFREIFGPDMFIFYAIFSPMEHLACALKMNWVGVGRIVELFKENEQAVEHALKVFSKDLCMITKKVLTEGGVDAIQFNVHNDRKIPVDIFEKYVKPQETIILETANQYSHENMLHICGYRGRLNNLEFYRDYPASLFNWAVHEEGLSLIEGKEYFHGKAVLGGFDQMPDGLMHSGNLPEIRNLVNELLSGHDNTGIIIGADCSLPVGTPMESILCAMEAAHSFGAKANK